MFFMSLQRDPRFFFAVVITVVFSVCLHELAHGIVAVWLGDRTPIEEDHMTLNPFVHMGVPSLICLALAGIAWGAMPVDERRMRGRYAPALVAIAGPLMNVALAVLALTALGLWFRFDLHSSAPTSDIAVNGRYLLMVVGQTNVLLALFNLLPIPPLDGSRILSNFSEAYDRMIHKLASSAPAAFMQISIVLIIVGSMLIREPAESIAGRIIALALGR